MYFNNTIFGVVMQSKVYSAAVVGVEAFEVEIEVHAGWGNTDKIAVVGLPDTVVKESKDRVTSDRGGVTIEGWQPLTYEIFQRGARHSDIGTIGEAF
jgi:hypothetical protein